MATSPVVLFAQQLAAGDYIIRIKYNAGAQSAITVKWATHEYPCPYHSAFPDVMHYAQGCTNPTDIGTPIMFVNFPHQHSDTHTTDLASVSATVPYKYPIYVVPLTAGTRIGVKLALVNPDLSVVTLRDFTIEMMVGSAANAR